MSIHEDQDRHGDHDYRDLVIEFIHTRRAELKELARGGLPETTVVWQPPTTPTPAPPAPSPSPPGLTLAEWQARQVHTPTDPLPDSQIFGLHPMGTDAA